jgi:NAD-dependent deacetylase
MLRGAVEAVLRAVGNSFFCDRVSSALLILLAFLTFSPQRAAYSLVGAAAALGLSRLLRLREELVVSGYCGFNGVLVGLYWPMFQPVSWRSLLALVVAAGLSGPLTVLLFRLLSESRLNLPILALPSLAVIWPACLLLPRWKIAWLPFHDILPENRLPAGLLAALQQGPWATYGVEIDWSLWLSRVLHQLPALVLFAIAFALHSRIIARSALAGLFGGYLLAVLLAGPQAWSDPSWAWFRVVTAPFVAIALNGFFLAPSRRTALYTVLAVIASLGVWVGCSLLLFPLGLPPLTAPFALTTLLFLLPIKLLAGGSPVSRDPYPVPLVQITSPEAAARWLEDQRMAEEFWHSLTLGDRAHWRLDMSRKIDRAAQLFLGANRIVAFTGAGISTESGIPDYRTEFLTWKKYDTEHFRFERFLASPVSREKYWEMSQDFYLLIQKAKPNPAHLALAELELEGKLLGIITQNVDRLHQKAGNSEERIVELHGSELTVSCLKCRRTYSREEIYHWILNGVKVPYCTSCQGILKPDSVAFGQPMPYAASQRAFQMTMACDLFLIVGSSLQVQPAALLPWKAREAGAKLVIVNLHPTQYDQHADVVIRQRAGKALPAILERMKRLQALVDVVPQAPGGPTGAAPR